MGELGELGECDNTAFPLNVPNLIEMVIDFMSPKATILCWPVGLIYTSYHTCLSIHRRNQSTRSPGIGPIRSLGRKASNPIGIHIPSQVRYDWALQAYI